MTINVAKAATMLLRFWSLRHVFSPNLPQNDLEMIGFQAIAQ